MTPEETKTLVQALQQEALSLGISWKIRPATVTAFDGTSTFVKIDGDATGDVAIPAIPLCAPPSENSRVMCLLTDPTTVYIIGLTPTPGTLVLKVRQNAGGQSIADGGSGTFVTFDTIDKDLFGTFDLGSPDRWSPPIPGWFFMNCRGVFVSNAVSRRGAFINTNGTTAAPGTVGGSSLQAPATGTAQLGGSGSVYLTPNDFIGVRLIQNSGAPLNTAGTDGGTTMEAIYVGSAP